MSSTPAAIPADILPKAQDGPHGRRPESRGHIGWVVAGSLALGWAMLAVLSMRFTDRPTPERRGKLLVVTGEGVNRGGVQVHAAHHATVVEDGQRQGAGHPAAAVAWACIRQRSSSTGSAGSASIVSSSWAA
jgi:hypothetical protein